MSFSSTTPLLSSTSTRIVSDKTITDMETKLNYIFRDKSHLLRALGARTTRFWTSARIWSNQAMLRSHHLDTSTESLRRAAKYLNLSAVISESSEEVCSTLPLIRSTNDLLISIDDALCETVKSVLVAVYMDSSDQRMMHHAANYIGVYVASPFGNIELDQEQ
jgi:hypothetical protein